jgi:hypothetical protein
VGDRFSPGTRNSRWIETSPTSQLAATSINVAELTEDWDEVMPIDEKVLDFGFGGIYDRQAVLDIEEFLQTPQATTGVAISLPHWSWCPGAWSPLHRVGGHQMDAVGTVDRFC